MLPLVENAFKHGAAATVNHPWINIQLQVQQQDLTLNISNSKPEAGVPLPFPPVKSGSITCGNG
ncbi:MAG: hypothetical protein QM664_09585 [Flavihumibacter sp.]